MSSIIPGFEYDIFISYRQKDNKGDRWVSSFVDALKTELESTFKEEISVYFDINPHDGLLETHDVDESLKEKLKCLVFIPIISRTYCDPKSFAWEHEIKAFVETASQDQFGLKVKLPNGNVASRVLPVRIHDLDNDDIKLCESILGGVLRGVEFIYKEPGVNRPLMANEDHPDNNLNKTFYRNQINKVANTIKDIISGLRNPDRESKEISKGIDEEKSSVRNNLRTKIIAGVLIALALIVAGYFIVPKLFKPSEELEKSIAVLPFRNDSSDPENEHLCIGMMDDILTQLQKIGDMRLKVRSGERYRNSDKDVTDIGRELGVSFIIQGSVRKVGENIRITAQLIDTKTRDQLWADKYDGKFVDKIFEFQSNVAKRVAVSLNAKITPQEERKIDLKPTTEMLAYDLDSKAGEMLRKWRYTQDSIDLNLAINLVNQALKVDPEYIDALASKGLIFIETGNYDSASFYGEKIRKIDPENFLIIDGIGLAYFYSNKPDSALKYFLKAEKLAPIDYLAWMNLVLGQTYCFFKGEVIKGFSYFQKAIDSGGDSYPEVHDNIALAYIYIGYYPKAEKYYRNVISLRSECSLIQKYVHILFIQGKNNEAFHFLDSISNITPCEQECDIIRFRIYAAQKEFEKAERYYNKVMDAGYKRTADDDIFIGYLYKETGRGKEELSILNNSIKRDESLLKTEKNVFIYYQIKLRIAAAYAILDDNEKALSYLSKFEESGIYETYFNARPYPGFDKLLDNPEFKAILKRLEDKRAANRSQIMEMERRGEINL